VRPTYAIVNTGIRRDLVAPLRGMQRLHLVHFYDRAQYNDLSAADMDPTLRRYRNSLDLLVQLWRARPDVIQTPDPFVLSLQLYLIVCLLVAVLQRAKLVVGIVENLPLEKKYHPLLAAVLRLLHWPVFAYASLIICLNQGARANVLRTGPFGAKTRHLMYGTWGVDVTEWSPLRDRREPKPGDNPSILFVGRLAAEKGVFDLLDAFGLLMEQEPQAHLVLIGDGPERATLEHLAHERGWHERVQFLGTVKNRDLPPYFRAATLFVAPSRTVPKWMEQVGMTNIQAMASGLPLVSTRSGAIPEYVPDGEAGLLVPEGNVRALAGAMATVLASPALQSRLGQQGRALAEQRYDATANVVAADTSTQRFIARQ
jgi:glycosyltransferase involved in cell wall biosynthesis